MKSFTEILSKEGKKYDLLDFLEEEEQAPVDASMAATPEAPTTPPIDASTNQVNGAESQKVLNKSYELVATIAFKALKLDYKTEVSQDMKELLDGLEPENIKDEGQALGILDQLEEIVEKNDVPNKNTTTKVTAGSAFGPGAG